MAKKRRDRFGQEIVSCKVCGDDTTMTGTRLCNGCWEFDSRKDDLIKRGNELYLRALAVQIEEELKQRA